MKRAKNIFLNNELYIVKGGVSYQKLNDFLFFFVFVIIPSSFFALVDQRFFYIKGFLDLELITWLLCLFYFIKIKNISKICLYPGIKALFLVAILVTIFYLYTSLFKTSFYEAFKIFRKGYFTIFSAIGLLLFIINLPSYRLIRIIKWITIAMTIQGVFFIIDNVFDISIFATKVYQELDYKGQIVKRHFNAFPIYNNIVYTIALVNVLSNKKKIWFIPLIISIICMLLISTRSALIRYIVIFILIFFFFSFSKRGKNIKNTFQLLIIFFITGFIYINFFSAYFNFFNERISEIEHEESIVEVGNFGFRLQLIEEAIESTKDNFLFLGNGYVRQAKEGKYDIALGGDTHLAAVIYTEGFLGLVFRLIPILILLIINIKELAKKNYPAKNYNILIIAIITGELVNIIQTTIFKNYDSIFIFLLIFEYLKREDIKRLRKWKNA